MKQPIRFTVHAIDRYREHVRDCPKEQAGRELAALAANAAVKPEPPAWVVRREETADGWLVLTEDLCCPLKAQSSGEMLAVSLLARGSLGEGERRWRSERKTYDRASRHHSKSKRKISGERPRLDPEASEWDIGTYEAWRMGSAPDEPQRRPPPPRCPALRPVRNLAALRNG